MIETRSLKNVVIFVQTILSFVLSRNIRLRELSFPKDYISSSTHHKILLFDRDLISRIGQIFEVYFLFLFQISVFLIKKKPWKEDKGL